MGWSAILAAVGARGQYLALANDGNDGERTVIADGKSRVASIVLHEVLAGAATEPDSVDYAAVIEEIFAHAPTPAPKKPKAKAAAAKKPTVKKKAAR